MIYAISEQNVVLNTIRNLNFETAFLNWYFITLFCVVPPAQQSTFHVWQNIGETKGWQAAHLNRLESFYILAFVVGAWRCAIFIYLFQETMTPINPFAKLPVSGSQLIVGMTRKWKARRNMSGAFFNSAYPIILEPGNFPIWTPKKQISFKGLGGGRVIYIDYFRIPW